MSRCKTCNGTGVYETGNNDLPCPDCPAGDKALFNQAGVAGPVTGAEVKKKHYPKSPDATQFFQQSPDATQVVVRLPRSPAMARALATLSMAARNRAYVLLKRADDEAHRGIGRSAELNRETASSLSELADALEAVAREETQ